MKTKLALGVAAFLVGASGFLVQVYAVEDRPALSINKGQEVSKGDVIDHSDGEGGHTFEQTYQNANVIYLTAQADAITINAITVNRGNCSLILFPPLPVELKFGEKLTYPAYCDPLEVRVVTDKGVFNAAW